MYLTFKQITDLGGGVGDLALYLSAVKQMSKWPSASFGTTWLKCMKENGSNLPMVHEMVSTKTVYRQCCDLWLSLVPSEDASVYLMYVRASVCVCVCACMPVCEYKWECVCAHASKHMQVCVCVHAFMCACVYMCVCFMFHATILLAVTLNSLLITLQ